MNIRDVSVLCYANGHTQFHYHLRDTPLPEALASGFFDEAVGLLTPGDIITLTSATEAATCLVTEGLELKLIPTNR